MPDNFPEILTIPARPQQVYESFWAKVRKASGQDGSPMKSKLLSLSKSGAPKPKYKTREYEQMIRYCRNDPDFRKTVEDNTPDWIETRREKRERELLEYAISGGGNPASGTVPGRAFYQLKKDGGSRLEELKMVRPDWFSSKLTTDEVIRLHRMGVSQYEWECSDLSFENVLKINNIGAIIPGNMHILYCEDYSVAFELFLVNEDLIHSHDDIHMVQALYANERHRDGKTIDDIPTDCHRLRRFVYDECSAVDWLSCAWDEFYWILGFIDGYDPDSIEHDLKSIEIKSYIGYHKYPVMKAFLKREKPEWCKDWGDKYDINMHNQIVRKHIRMKNLLV